MDGRIFQLKKKLLNNLQHQWTVEEMAQTVGISAPHLQKLFKIQTEISPVQYLRTLRLEKARELLENSFKQVSEIGFEVGMVDQSHFTRDFKQKYGSTPSAYRKEHWTKLEAGSSIVNK